MPHDFNDIQFWKQNVIMDLDILTLMTLHGNVCLALRHPGNGGSARGIMIQFVKKVGRHLVELGALTEKELKQIEKTEQL